MKISDAILGAVLLLLGVTILVHVQSFPKIPGQQVGPALMPGTISVGLVVCGVLLVISGWRKRATEPWTETADWMRSGRHLLAFAAIVGGIAAYVWLAQPLGFLVVGPVLLVVWFVILGIRPLPAAAIAVIAALVIWFAFYKLLRVPLPWGLLTKFAF
jgi:putative tricarboxylic transport membrane protein